uniref:Serine protease n=1 Tax=Aplanochytrium stocchinoi TaxID=215587 RepID=A0A7S3V0V6_9STRA
MMKRVQRRAQAHNIDVTVVDVSSAIDWMNDTGRIIRNENSSNISGPVTVTSSNSPVVNCENVHDDMSMIFLDPDWLVDLIKQLVDHNEKSEKTLLQRFLKSKNSNISRQLQRNPSRGLNFMQRDMGGRIRNDVKRLRTRAVLTESLLPFLWPELFENIGNTSVSSNDVVKHLLQVLQEFDICYEISSNPNESRKTKRSWLVPCLLTEKFDLKKHWYMEDEGKQQQSQNTTAQLDGHRTVEIGRRYTFTRFSPPGLIGRLLNHVFMNTNSEPASNPRSLQPFPPQVWVDAAKFGFPSPGGRSQQGFRLLIYLYENKENEDFETEFYLDVVARGDTRALIGMWEALLVCFDAVEKVLYSYPGLIWQYFIPCPICKFQMQGTDVYAFDQFEIEDYVDVDQVWQSILQINNYVEDDTDPTYGCRAVMPCEAENAMGPHNCPAVFLLPPSPELIALRNHILEERQYRSIIAQQEQDGSVLPSRKPYELCFNGNTGICIDARAVVKVAIYDRSQRILCQQGSGFVVDKELGLILTAAHLVLDPTTRVSKFDDFPISVHENEGRILTPEQAEMCRYWFVIGTFVGERQAPEWTYKAVGVKYDVESEVCVDALVIRVCGLLDKKSPTSKSRQVEDAFNTSPVGTICGTVNTFSNNGNGGIFDTINLSSDEEEGFLPLPAELSLGDSNQIRVNDRVSLAGFPPLRGESICCDSGVVNQLIGNIFINCTVFQHSGSSGGPLVDEHGKVIGVLSKGFRPGDFGQHIAINCCTEILNEARLIVAAESEK